MAIALAAILLLGVTLEGHLMVPMPMYLRPVLAVGALLMLNTNLAHDVVGLALVVTVLLVQAVLAKRQNQLRLAAI